MANLAKLKKQLFAELDEKFGDGLLNESLMSSMLIIVQSINGANNEEDDEVVPAKRSKLKTEEPEADDDEPEADEDDNDDDEPEVKPKRNSGAKKVTATKPAAKVTKPAPKAAPVNNSFEGADFADADTDVKEMVEKIGLNLKKAKVSKDADVRKLLKSIQALSKKKPVTYFEKLATKAEVAIVQPRGRSSEEKKSRVAIVALINAGHSPIAA